MNEDIDYITFNDDVYESLELFFISLFKSMGLKYAKVGRLYFFNYKEDIKEELKEIIKDYVSK